MMRIRSKVVLWICLLAGAAVEDVRLAEAQTIHATLTGTVTDQSGSIVPNATVTATHEGTQIEYRAVSNGAGVYSLPFLPLGTYVVTVGAAGFKTGVTNPIQLEVNQIARLDLRLELGPVTQQVEVIDVAPILQTESVTVGEAISATTTANLPLNGRNFQQLTLFVPGSINPDPVSFNSVGGQGRPFVNGNREQGNSFLLDGISIDETIDNRIGYHPNIDAIAEFKIETNNSSAEFGNVTGAVVITAMKSGTNQFHGSLFEFFRNEALDANSWSNNRNSTPQLRIGKTKFRQSIWGGTAGGPIVRNKIFFSAPIRTHGSGAAVPRRLLWLRPSGGEETFQAFPSQSAIRKRAGRFREIKYRLSVSAGRRERYLQMRPFILCRLGPVQATSTAIMPPRLLPSSPRDRLMARSTPDCLGTILFTHATRWERATTTVFAADFLQTRRAGAAGLKIRYSIGAAR